MKEYQKLIRQWLMTQLFLICMALIGVLVVTIVGVIREQYLLMVAVNVSLVIVWYLARELLQFAKPMPPMKIIPMPLPPKESNDESGKN